MAQLPQVDAKIAANQSVRSREFINGFFRLKIAIFSTASTLHSEGIYPKSYRLDLLPMSDFAVQCSLFPLQCPVLIFSLRKVYSRITQWP